MSSLVRRIQKNIAKAQGFHKSLTQTVTNKAGQVKRLVVNSDGEPVGHLWPQVSAPTKEIN